MSRSEYFSSGSLNDAFETQANPNSAGAPSRKSMKNKAVRINIAGYLATKPFAQPGR
jgi:hypothetical protein